MKNEFRSDQFGIKDWDKWTFAHSLKAHHYPEKHNSKGGYVLRAAADHAFFSKEYEDAADLYNQLSSIYSDNLSIYLRLLHCLDATCNWEARTNFVDKIFDKIKNEGAISLEPLCYLSIPMTLEQSSIIAKRRETLLKIKKNLKLKKVNSPGQSKIKIGYLSIDFRAHTCGAPLWPIIQHHDRSIFEAYSFSISNDPTLENIVQNCSDFHFNISNMTWVQTQKMILDLEIDILIDTTRHVRGAPTPLFSERLAKTQISAWGYGGTSGITSIDAVLGDPITLKNSDQDFYTEEFIKLPSYLPFETSNTQGSTTKNDKTKMGLPENATVFACFTNHYKISKSIFLVWLRILKYVPDSILVLADGNKHSRKRLSVFAENFQLDPNRIKYWPRVDHKAHLKRFGLIDIILDNPRMGGSASVLDGLSIGRPCVTVEGDVPEDNGAASILHALNLDAFIADNWIDYEKTVLNLAKHPANLSAAKKATKAAIKQNNPAYINNFVSGLETSVLNYVSSKSIRPYERRQ